MRFAAAFAGWGGCVKRESVVCTPASAGAMSSALGAAGGSSALRLPGRGPITAIRNVSIDSGRRLADRKRECAPAAPKARGFRVPGRECGKQEWCPGAESNHRHDDFQSSALPLSYPGISVAAAEPARRSGGRLWRRGGGLAIPHVRQHDPADHLMHRLSRLDVAHVDRPAPAPRERGASIELALGPWAWHAAVLAQPPPCRGAWTSHLRARRVSEPGRD